MSNVRISDCLNGRSVRLHPAPGDVAGGRDRPRRTVTKLFIDATGQPYVVYTEERRIPLTAWKRWFRAVGATVVK